MLFLCLFVSLFHFLHFIKCDSFEWLLELQVDKKSPKFQGSAFIRFETDSGNENSNNFKTEEQMFDVQFRSGETVQRDLLLSFPDLDADIRVEFFFASFSCDQKRKLLPVRFQAVRLISGFAGKTYFAGNVSPKTAHAVGQCANATIFRDFSIIEKWIVSDSTVCFFDGKFYKHLAEVKSGCRRKCLCRQGLIECANQCQEDEVQADTLVVCRSMNALGECCPKTECQRNSSDFLNVVKCQDPKVVLPAEENRQEMIVPPWSYFIVVNRYSANNAATWCGATLVDEKWVLTPAHCLYTADSPNRHFVLSTPNFVEIYKPDAEEASVNLVGRTAASKILSLKVHPNYQRPGDESLSKSRRYSSFDFAMLELDPPIRPSPHEQPINLPWTSECYQFVDNARCKVSSTRYFNDSSRLVFEPLIASNVILPNGQCHKGPSFFCYEQQKTTPKSEDAPSGPRRGTDGSGVVVKRNDFYELIGLILNAEDDWRTSKTSSSLPSISDAKVNILTICEILQWINTTVTNN